MHSALVHTAHTEYLIARTHTHVHEGAMCHTRNPTASTLIVVKILTSKSFSQRITVRESAISITVEVWLSEKYVVQPIS